MRTLSTALTASLGAEEANTRWLFQMDPLYYTNADTPVVYDGDKYEPMGFEVESAQGASNFGTNNVRIRFDNVDREFSAVVLSQDVANKECSLKLQHVPYNAPSSNLVPNGDCETTAGWVRYGDTATTFALSTEHVYDGEKAIWFNAEATSGLGITSNRFSLVAGQKYLAQAYVYSANATKVQFAVRAGSGDSTFPGNFLSTLTTGVFNLVSGTFTEVSGGSSARALLHNNGSTTGEWWVDAVSVVPVKTTPATFDVYDGFVTKWEIDNHTASLDIGSEFMLWGKKTLRLPTPNCPWSFKGTECGYSGGETWCDKSPERCTEIANYSNFGGRKFIASLEGQKIFWGPKGY